MNVSSAPVSDRSAVCEMELHVRALNRMNEKHDTWVERLAATGAVRDDALVALRAVLISRLRKAFQGRTGVDEALLEDVVQEALVKTLDNLNQFKGRSRFMTWATTIAVRVAFTELRRRNWKDLSLDEMLENTTRGAEQIVNPGSEPPVQFQHEELVQDMYRIIDTELTEKQKSALLAELKGMPLEEIGRRMGSNRNAIYKLTHDARKSLKQGLESAGYTSDDLQTFLG